MIVDDEEVLVRLGEEMIAKLGYEPVGYLGWARRWKHSARLRSVSISCCRMKRCRA